jgi:8-amino-7-oxononanoate synthase
MSLPRTPIAIVGMACRFPGARDLGAFWDNVRQGRVSFADVPAERWDHAMYHHPDTREIDKTYAKKLGLIDDIWRFPALHYGMAPLRVKVMDPQQRLMLEAARAALADAGWETRAYPKATTGVFVGACIAEHRDVVTSRLRVKQLLSGQFGAKAEVTPAFVDALVEDVAPMRAFTLAGNLINMTAATVAQTFDLGGAAFTVDAACASSLVAVHEAVLQLRAGLCDAAIAGGVHLNLSPDNMVAFGRIGAISRQDACRPFDEAADGFVLGEGAGAVILRRLDDALAAGDRIYAVIRGSGVSNDGRGDGPMTPRREGQLEALRRAYADAEVDPKSIGYVEAHGTATGIGDVVEIAALRDALGPETRAAVGSVKANIGHLMGGAGIAGLIKAALVVSEARIPRQAAYEKANPALALGDGLYVPTREEAWAGTRRAGVSSFGFGGTNAHVVMEQAPAVATVAPRPELFVVSAPTPELLVDQVRAVRAAAAEAPLADLARTLAERTPEKARLAFVARTREELLARLDDAARLEGVSYRTAPLAEAERSLVFLFPGQGAQQVGLARGLATRFPRFRARLEVLAGPLLRYVWPEGDFDPLEAEQALKRTEICQPVLAAISLAMAELLAELGVIPAATAGHSLGEFVAAGAAGMLGAEETVRFVAARGQVMADLALADPGAMAAVGATPDRLAPFVAELPGVVVANRNHPTQTVVSGTTEGVLQLVDRLGAAGIKATRLAVSHAFHSPLMAGAAPGIDALVDGLGFATPRATVISCIAPGPLGDDARAVWKRHATAPVDFTAGVAACADAGGRVFVQVGAGNALLTMARATLAPRGVPAHGLATLGGPDDDGGKLLEALGELYVLGAPVDVARLCEGASLAWLPATPLPAEEYRAHVPRPHAPIPVLASPEQEPMTTRGPNQALVALMREQVALFQSQADALRKLAEGIGLQASDPPVPLPPGPAPDPAPGPDPLPGPMPDPTPGPEPKPPGSVQQAADAEIESRMLDLVAQISAFPRASLDPDKRLGSDLGFDSLMVVDLVGKANEAFPGLGTLPKSLFVNDPTSRKLARHVAELLRAKHDDAPSVAPVTAVAAPLARYVPAFVPAPLPRGRADLAPSFLAPVVVLAPSDLTVSAIAATVAERLGAKVATSVDGLGEARTVVDLRALAPSSGATADTLAALALVRALARGNGRTLLFVHGEAAASIPAFARSLQEEWQGDRVVALAVRRDASAAAQIVDELAGTDRSPEVSVLSGTRALPVLVAAPPVAAGSLPTGVVTVVSGGTRGLGARIARALGTQHRARIALLGRRADAETEATVAAIRAAGGEARVFLADMADATAVRAAVDEARRAFGPIELAVHAAGVLRDKAALAKTDDDVTAVFGAKVDGARHLLAATVNDPLRTLLVLGSWAGRFGNGAQTDYAAANRAVAALARTGTRVVTVALPPWEGTQMVEALPAAVRTAMRQAGVGFLDDATGLPALLAELADAKGPSELLFARGEFPAARRDVAVHTVTLATHPYLGDHRLAGRPVLPLASAADLALAAGRRVAGAVRLVGFELGTGVRLDDDAQAIDLVVDATPTAVAIHVRGKDETAYRGRFAPLAPLSPLASLPFAEAGKLSLDEFYARHTFHGPRLRGIVRVDGLSDAGITGVVRASAPGDLTSVPVEHALDPLALDAAFQLAGYWATVKHGRGGLPLGAAEIAVHRAILPGAELHAQLVLEKAEGNLLVCHLDLRDASGQLVVQVRGLQAELSGRPAAQVPITTVDEANWRVEKFPEYLALRQRIDMAQAMGLTIPYFNLHEGITSDTSVIDGREMVNFSSYNYLGLSGDAEVTAAASAAMERYGTSVSASRIASGEKPLHRELEGEIAAFLGAEASIVMVGGHATNVATVGHLLGQGDLIVHDALAHDSILSGARLSGARRRPFPHNDAEALDRLLTELRPQFRRVLIAIEGTYSMDGDIPPLDQFIAVKKKHGAMLLVDEAHSLGVLGTTGRGIGEHFRIDPADVDLWMGTLSKSLASCGGYIAGSKALVEYLKYTAGGFVYSVGISPANAAAALAALRKLDANPELVSTLHARSRFFLEAMRSRGIRTGMSSGTAVVPCIVPSSLDCLMLAQALGRRGINVQPILYPAVEEHLARLRFFVTARHSEAQLEACAQAVVEELTKINPAHLLPVKSANGVAHGISPAT